MHRYWDEGVHRMMDFNFRIYGWFIFFGILRVLVVVALVILTIKIFTKKSNANKVTLSNRAVEILKERYATGEISDEEYRSKLDNLIR